jgi:prepilin-type N-terminal cleavage/methylation domain-containing protein
MSATRLRSRGFTLAELMVVVSCAGVFGGTLTAVGLHVHAQGRASAGRQADLDGLRRAARLLDDDVRSGRLGRAVRWSLDDAVLRRDDVPVLASVASFEAAREGDVWRLRVALRPRVTEGPRREAVLDWSVRARVEDAR